MLCLSSFLRHLLVTPSVGGGSQSSGSRIRVVGEGDNTRGAVCRWPVVVRHGGHGVSVSKEPVSSVLAVSYSELVCWVQSVGAQSIGALPLISSCL
jgi:hypothetical protein